MTNSIFHYVERDVKTSLIKTPDGKYQLRVNLGTSILSEMNQCDFDLMLEILTKMKTGESTEYFFPTNQSALMEKIK